MGILSHLFYPWGLLLQAAAIIHFIRRRPDTYWIYIILFLGPVGALVYLFAEALPDVGLLNQSFKGISRRKHIKALELVIRDNPSAGNYEELGELCLEEGKLQLARNAFDKAIAADPTKADAYYWKGSNLMQLATVKGDKMITPDGTAESFQKYLELKPDGPHAEECKAMLQGMGATIETSYGKKKAAPVKK